MMTQLSAASKLLSQIASVHFATAGSTSSSVPDLSAQPPEMPESLAGVLTVIRKAEEEAAKLVPREAPDASLGSLYEKAATDGELLDEGIVALLDALQMPEDAVFADLGSGRGGALIRVAAASRLRHCVGIELISSKHKAAAATLSNVRDVMQTPVSFLEGDLIDVAAWSKQRQEAISKAEGAGKAEGGDGGSRDGSSSSGPTEIFGDDGSSDDACALLSEVPEALCDLTHAFTCSICFDDFLLRKIAASLADREAFPRMQALVSTRTLPSQPHFVKIGTLPLTCSWAVSST